LKRDGTMTLVGAPARPAPVAAFNLLMKRRRLTGSAIGGLRETPEMLDFCAEHGIVSDIELIPIQQINDAYERLLKGDVKYRFVIDIASFPGNHAHVRALLATSIPSAVVTLRSRAESATITRCHTGSHSSWAEWPSRPSSSS
jgi:hypothetical protein